MPHSNGLPGHASGPSGRSGDQSRPTHTEYRRNPGCNGRWAGLANGQSPRSATISPKATSRPGRDAAGSASRANPAGRRCLTRPGSYARGWKPRARGGAGLMLRSDDPACFEMLAVQAPTLRPRQTSEAHAENHDGSRFWDGQNGRYGVDGRYRVSWTDSGAARR